MSLMTCVALSLSLFGSGGGIFDEMTLTDGVNFVRYHRQFGTLIVAARFAQIESKRRFPNDPQAPNGKGNAFQHALWSAMLGAGINEKIARRITDGHEDWPGNPANERSMDLHNNSVGIAVGGKLRGRPRTEIADAIQRELRAGNLRYLKGGRLVPTNE